MAQTREAKYMTIDTFRGVDFSNDDMAVNSARSPIGRNIIADVAGRPELRPGITPLMIKNENGGYPKVGTIYAITQHNEYTIICSAYGPYACKREGQEYIVKYKESMSIFQSNKNVAIFKMNDLTYIISSTAYIYFRSSLPVGVEPDTEEAEKYPLGFSIVEPYIPTTTINRTPAGGGVVYEAINLISPRRKNSFVGDGTTSKFWLDGKLYTDYDSQFKAEVNGSMAGIKSFGNATREGFGDAEYGWVELNNVPPDGNGIDNVVITYQTADENVNKQNKDKILKCTIASTYGVGNDSRVFVSGNSDFPNMDFCSALYDPTYFPDTGFTQIGDDGPIYGYLKNDGKQVVIKKSDEGQSNLFLRNASLQETLAIDGENSETTTVFSVTEGIAGLGLCAVGATVNINGDAMFLTPQGLYGLETNSVTNQRTAQLRSFYINRKLVKENLKEAHLCAWGKYVIIAVENHMYIGDTQQTNENPNGYIGYEWYYWELPVDIRINTITNIDGTLVIGLKSSTLTQDKPVVYEFKSTADGMKMYSDEIDGERLGIDAVWSTPILYGGDFMRYKTISKRGCGVLAKPFSRGSGEILITTDKSLQKGAGEFTTDIFDWNDIDFNRFTFNMREEPRVKVYPKKHRKVLFFQMAVRHTAPDEGFGIAAMRIAYTLGSLTKRGN